jgi:hypothetical protein
LVVADGSSPQVFDGSSPKAVMSTVWGRWISAVGGPRCGFSGSALSGLNAELPAPCDWSISCARPQPKPAPVLSYLLSSMITSAPPLLADQSRRSAAFWARVAPAVTVKSGTVTTS